MYRYWLTVKDENANQARRTTTYRAHHMRATITESDGTAPDFTFEIVSDSDLTIALNDWFTADFAIAAPYPNGSLLYWCVAG